MAPIMMTPMAPPEILVIKLPIVPAIKPPKIIPRPAKTSPQATINAIGYPKLEASQPEASKGNFPNP